MATFTRFSTLSLVLFVLASGFASATKLDSHNWPVVIAPGSTTIAQGQSTSVGISMNQAGTTPTTVYLTSSHPGLLYVPASITVPAGVTSTSVDAEVIGFPDDERIRKAKADNTATTVRITASANGRSAYTDVTVQ